MSTNSITCRICRTQRYCEQLSFEMSRRTFFWGEESVRVVTHNPHRVVTPISPCGISVINKKAHGQKCWLCLWISSLFPTRDAVEILLWSSIGKRLTAQAVKALRRPRVGIFFHESSSTQCQPFFPVNFYSSFWNQNIKIACTVDASSAKINHSRSHRNTPLINNIL